MTFPKIPGAGRPWSNVVMMNSDRSLVSPRSAVTATGSEEEMSRNPNWGTGLLKGGSLINRATCELGGTVNVPLTITGEPGPAFRIVKDTVAGTVLGFAIATPVFTGPSTST